MTTTDGVKVIKSYYNSAFCSAPTRHWRGVMNGAQRIIEAHILEDTDDYFVVDRDAWAQAMQKLAYLPAGGRHVAEERRLMSWRLQKALKENNHDAHTNAA